MLVAIRGPCSFGILPTWHSADVNTLPPVYLPPQAYRKRGGESQLHPQTHPWELQVRH